MTKRSTTNETKELYYKSPAAEKKVNLATVIIVCFITLIVGFLAGKNWDGITQGFNAYLGGKTAKQVDFNKLKEVYDTLALNFDGEIDTKKVIEEAKRGLVNAAGDKYTYPNGRHKHPFSADKRCYMDSRLYSGRQEW